ncbi:MAG: RDD family protein [Gammaproteobacteria bacterium]|nr:RDD family protein [Gammaproteobacteria bacterium]
MQSSPEPESEASSPASLMRRIVALAVDLSVVLGIGSLALLLISLWVPLDGAEAQTPRGLVFILAAVYLVWARDHGWPSLGRRLLKLRLLRVRGLMPSFLSKAVTVNIDPDGATQGNQVTNAIIASGACSMVAAAALVSSLHSTVVFQTAREHVSADGRLLAAGGQAANLSPFAQSLLIGDQRAYLRVGLDWPDAGNENSERAEALEFFLVRPGPGDDWRVQLSRPVPALWRGRYGLFVADDEIPAAPHG